MPLPDGLGTAPLGLVGNGTDGAGLVSVAMPEGGEVLLMGTETGGFSGLAVVEGVGTTSVEF